MAPPAAPRSGRVEFVFIYRMSYVGLTCQHLATAIRYADHVKQHFRASRRHQAENFSSLITRLIRLWYIYSQEIKCKFLWSLEHVLGAGNGVEMAKQIFSGVYCHVPTFSGIGADSMGPAGLEPPSLRAQGPIIWLSPP